MSLKKFEQEWAFPSLGNTASALVRARRYISWLALFDEHFQYPATLQTQLSAEFDDLVLDVETYFMDSESDEDSEVFELLAENLNDCSGIIGESCWPLLRDLVAEARIDVGMGKAFPAYCWKATTALAIFCEALEYVSAMVWENLWFLEEETGLRLYAIPPKARGFRLKRIAQAVRQAGEPFLNADLFAELEWELAAARRYLRMRILDCGRGTSAPSVAEGPGENQPFCETIQSDLAGSLSRNEERDEWLYQECCKGTPHATISLLLRKMAGDRDWYPIDSPNGIGKAARRYADRKGLPHPPSRKNAHRAKRMEQDGTNGMEHSVP